MRRLLASLLCLALIVDAVAAQYLWNPRAPFNYPPSGVVRTSPLNPYAPTYQAAGAITSISAADYDMACIEPGSGGTRLLSVWLGSPSAAIAGAARMRLFSRSSTSTGGTSTTLTAVPRDSQDPASKTTVRIWSGSQPTVTGPGTIVAQWMFFGLGGAATSKSSPSLYSFVDGGQAMFIRSGEAVCLSTHDNLAGGVVRATFIFQDGP